MATYKVEKKGEEGSWFIVGLPSPSYFDGDYEGAKPEEPSPDHPNTWLKVTRNAKGIDLFEDMYGALYDEYQCNDRIKKGDIFVTPVGQFIAEGVHILPHDEVAKNYLNEVNEIYKCENCGCDQGGHRTRYGVYDGIPYYAECFTHKECKEFKKRGAPQTVTGAVVATRESKEQ